MTTNPQMMMLLDKYAQEAGFANLADMKNNYSDRTYSAVLAPMVRRAKAEMDVA